MKTLAEANVAVEIRMRLKTMTEFDQSQWGVMMADDALRHLRAAFLVAIEQPALSERMRPLPKSVIKFLGLRLPLRWPKNGTTLPGLFREDLGNGSFSEDQASLLQSYDVFLRMEPNRWLHPDFGQMSRWDWMRWGYLHADHHLRQFGR